jgi:WD40 repeat protein
MKATSAAVKSAILTLTCLAGLSALAGTTQRIIWQASNAGRAIAISADGQLILTGMQARHTSDGSLLRTFQIGYSGTSVNSNAFSRDGKLVAFGIQSFNRNLLLFAVDGTKLAGPISAHNNGTSCVAFSPNGELLASGGRDGTVKLWHLPDMTLLRTLNGGVGYRPRVSSLLFSNDGETLVLGSQGGVLQYRVSDGQFLRQLTAVNTLSLALSSDGTTMVSGSDEIDQNGQCTDCTIKGWNPQDGSPLGTIPGNNNGVTALAFSPDRQEIAAGAGDRTYGGSIRFFSASTGQLQSTWFQDANNPSSYVTSVAYSPFGRMIAYARADGVVIAAFDRFVTGR